MPWNLLFGMGSKLLAVWDTRPHWALPSAVPGPMCPGPCPDPGTQPRLASLPRVAVGPHWSLLLWWENPFILKSWPRGTTSLKPVGVRPQGSPSTGHARPRWQRVALRAHAPPPLAFMFHLGRGWSYLNPSSEHRLGMCTCSVNAEPTGA